MSLNGELKMREYHYKMWSEKGRCDSGSVVRQLKVAVFEDGERQSEVKEFKCPLGARKSKGMIFS
jgi:hypothetical protein